MQIRVAKDFRKPLARLADRNRRSVAAETNLAIEAHLAANRDALKTGPKLARK